jgi:hypothetical protein
MRKNQLPTIITPVMFLIILVLFCLLLYYQLENGTIQNNKLSIIISIITLFSSLTIAFFSLFISWKALVFTALPRIDISLSGTNKKNKLLLPSNTSITLCFIVKNIGWWYAKPAVTNAKLFLNVDPEFRLKLALFGSNLELRENRVKRGIQKSKYIEINGIHLYNKEEAERVKMLLATPNKPGRYRAWISAISDQCDHDTFEFTILIKE